MFNSWMKKSFVFGMSFTLLAPNFSHAFGESSVIEQYVGDAVLAATTVPLVKPTWGKFILHSEQLNRLYKERQFRAIWVKSDGTPSDMAIALRTMLVTAESHGLRSSDYWDEELEILFNAMLRNPKNWVTFELAATEALIRYATHLSTGRFDPKKVDDDIRFSKKRMEVKELAWTLDYGAVSFAGMVEQQFSPGMQRYRDLKDILQRLRMAKDSGAMEKLTQPTKALKKNDSDPMIQKLRNRFNLLGYKVSNNGGNLFDDEFLAVVKLYQTQNGLGPDGIVGGEVFRHLGVSVDDRIAQVEATMEKLRWLPKDLEPTHVFVNLAVSEFRLFENGALVPGFYFRTINGQSVHRTPSMKDKITHVILNPYWTVPESIAMRLKVPELRKNPNYLTEHNYQLLSSRTDQPVDPYSIPWNEIRSEGDLRKYEIYIRQNPGADNALGMVKFPLTNGEAIYMHDTNEKEKFAEKNRHYSSGCVRLQRPLEFAAYLLNDNSKWDINSIRAYVPFYNPAYIPGAWNTRVEITPNKHLPVYMIYLTAEKGEGGEIRFVADTYGQDARLIKTLKNIRQPGELF